MSGAWCLAVYLSIGAVHALGLLRRERAQLTRQELAEIPWWWLVILWFMCEALWPVIPLMALIEGYYTLFSRSKWAEEKRREGWPIGDHGKRRYQTLETALAEVQRVHGELADLYSEFNALRQSKGETDGVHNQ